MTSKACCVALYMELTYSQSP